MAKSRFRLLIMTAFLLAPGVTLICSAQKGKNKVGAYYFDGWSGTTFHITEDLKKNYPDREPVWGWVTTKQEIVDEQIQLAVDAGLAYFSFCWYNKNGKKPEEIAENRALSLFKASKNVKKLEYCLLVANHQGFDIGPDNWEQLTGYWIAEFQHPKYLKVNQKPLLIFFESGSLVKAFGNTGAVKEAFDRFRSMAVKAGLKGVSIAICGSSPGSITTAENCGADVITGYNYHSIGFKGSKQAIPIDTLQNEEQLLWTRIAQNATKPYIPVSTMGWDPRPWSNERNKYIEKPYFTGFSANSVENSVKGLLAWMNVNPTKMTGERLALLYAWNENGEGAWLTPGKSGPNPLVGLKKALKKK